MGLREGRFVFNDPYDAGLGDVSEEDIAADPAFPDRGIASRIPSFLVTAG
jgi:hypothetical protein